MGEIRPFWGRLNFVRPSGRMIQAPAEKKIALFFAQKTPEKSTTKKRKTDRTRLRGRTNITAQTYETEEVYEQKKKVNN